MIDLLLKGGRKALEVSGVLGKTSLGFPVPHRRKRLTIALGALMVALLTHFGVPEEIAQPLADVVTAVALPDTL